MFFPIVVGCGCGAPLARCSQSKGHVAGNDLMEFQDMHIVVRQNHSDVH